MLVIGTPMAARDGARAHAIWSRPAALLRPRLARAARLLAPLVPPRLRPRVSAASGLGRSAVSRAFRADACAFCAEHAEAEVLRQFWFLQEQYGTFPWISRLQRAHGFCRDHLERLIRSDQRYRLSYVAQYLCDGLQQRLLALLEARSRLAQERARRALLPSEPCPACSDGRRHLEWFAGELVVLLEEPHFREELTVARPLCLDHLQLTLSIARGEVRALLLAVHRSKLLALRAELESDTTGAAAVRALRILLGPS